VTTTSPGAGSGAGTSRTENSRGPVSTNARMARSVSSA
jgi:hypothetical protein